MRSIDLTEIRELPLFTDMADDNFEQLMRGAYLQNFPPQVELISEGDHSDFLHIVVEGSVELFASWNNRETTMATVRPISAFILAAALKDAPCLMSARTLEKAKLILLPAVDVRAVFEIDNSFARAVVTELAQCYRGVIKSTKNLKLRTSIERLANQLIKLHVRSGGLLEFSLNVEKKRLASYLGMTPENLSRAFKTLQAYGVIIDGQNVKLTDIQSLKDLAKPTALIDDPKS
ncbi:helix-turn-helix domain-containing protein [Amylibacter sp. SFDW26]|uniref:helix-turn-helix domain-containing protein n=1 Tax=Amylibacter sp. SFDW26 TaxID=2652722 RepID=UPI0012615A58|nr:helix-turn-helix domain-containing protein [Amylibacter sp. SFDW26]KAB7610170.1 helix-turn-helix domain-containing protein [Amylibacter sp. SFDW26]